MKYKACSILLCFVLFFTLWTAVAGSDTRSADSVAKLEINGVTEYFDTNAGVSDVQALQAAWAAAQGKTAVLTLLKSVTLSESAESTMLQIQNADTNITLDMAEGVSLSSDSSSNRSVIVLQSGSLTLRSGAVRNLREGSSSYQTYVVTVSGGALSVGENATISGGTYGVNGSAGNISVAGTVSSGHSGLYLYPSGSNSCSLEMTGGSVTGGTYGIWSLVNASVRVSGGTVSGDAYGLYVNGSQVELSGGQFSSVAQLSTSRTVDEFLAEDYSYKTASNWIDNIKVTSLSGPLFVQQIPVKVKDPRSVTVKLGSRVELSVTATPARPDAQIAYQWYQVMDQPLPATAVAGGTGATLVLPSMSQEGEFSYYCVVTCDGYTAQSEPATITVGAYAAYLDVNGEQSSYMTLQAAWEAARTAGRDGTPVTLTLLGDASLATGTANYLQLTKEDEKCHITLIGSQHTVKTKGSRLFRLQAGVLTIVSGNYEVETTVTGAYCAEVSTPSGSNLFGTLELQGGSLRAMGNNGRALYVNKGVVSMSGGSIEGKLYGVYVTTMDSRLTVSGGRIEGQTGLYAYKGTTTLSGGTISASGTVLNAYQSNLGALLADGYAIYQEEGGWLYKTSASKLLGNIQILPVPVRIESITGEDVIYKYDHYQGQEMHVNAVPLNPAHEISYQWYQNGSPIAGATMAGYKVPDDLVSLKYQYTCQVVCDEYVLMTPAIVVTVVEEDFVCNTPSVTAVYGQTLREVEIPNPEENTSGTWVWDNPDLPVGNVGTKTFTATFYPTRSEVFDPVPKVTISVQVKKSAPELAFATDYDPSQVYTGQALLTPTRRYVIIAGVTEGELRFSWYQGDGAVEENKLPSAPVNAGTYTLKAELLETDNSFGSSDTIPVVISSREFEPTILTTSSMTYSGMPVTPNVVIRDGSVLVPESEYTVSYSDNIAAGTATVTISDNPGGNYVVGGETTFQITPRSLTIATVEAKNKEYDGESDVEISSVVLANVAQLADGTLDDVRVDMSGGIVAEVALPPNGHPNHGSYTRVLLPELTLTGEQAENYILVQQPSQSVQLSRSVIIQKTTLPESVITGQKRISTRYNYEYQWSIEEVRPEIHEPMRYEHPQYSIAEVNIDPLYYNASGTQVSLAGEDNSIIKVPITLDASVKEPESEILIGTVSVRMSFLNYNDITYEQEIYAGNWITAEIVGITGMDPVDYDGQPHLGFVNEFGELCNANARPTDEGLVIEGDVAYRVFYSGTGDTVYNSPPTEPPHNAGTYLVTVEIAEHECNYIGIGYYHFTINKRPTVFTAPVAKTGLVYNRGVKALIEPGSTEDGTMLYALREKGMRDEDLAFSKNIPTATQAGTYTVCYMVSGDGNHRDSDIYELEVTIDQAALMDYTLSGRGELAYNGREQALVIGTNSVSYGALQYSLDGENYSVDVPTAENAGVYTVYYKLVSSDPNYKDSEPKTLDVTIAKRTLRIISSAAQNRPYDGTGLVDILSITVFPIVTGDDVKVDVEGLQAMLVLEEGEHPNVGEYGLANLLNQSDLELIGADAVNYELVQPTGPVQLYARLEILKATLPSEKPGAGGQMMPPTTKKEISNSLNAVYRWEASDFYHEDIPDAVRAFNTPVLSVENVYFYLDAYNDEGAWIEDNALVVPIKSVNTQLEDTIAVVTLRQEYTNYEPVNFVVELVSINKAVADISGVTSMGEVTYTGSSVIGFTGTPVSSYTGQYNISYKGTGSTSYPQTTVPPVAVGTYRVDISIPDTVPEYVGSISLPFSIVKADPVITGLNARSDLHYNGRAQVLVTAGQVNGGTLVYALELEEQELVYTAQLPTATETGTYVVWYKVIGDDNFNDLPAQSITVEIGEEQEQEVLPVVPTIVSVATVVQDGKATASINSALSYQLTSQAKSQNSDSIVVDVQIARPTTEVDVTLQASAVKTFAESSALPVKIATPLGDVTLSAAAMDQINEGASDLYVAVKQVEDGVALSIRTKDQTLASVDGGVILAIPCENADANTVAMLVGEDGSLTMLPKSVLVDGKLYVQLDGSATVVLRENTKQFDDVAEDHWAAEAIEFVSSHNLMNGMYEGGFGADAAVTRGMLAQILYNLENNPENEKQNLFTDVPDTAWYADAVDWAADQGIIKGYGSEEFGPNNAIRREQLAAMLYRYMGSPDPGDAELNFQDADEISAYAVPAMRWAVKTGLFSGRTNNVLAPTDVATRAETAVVIQRLCMIMADVK